MCNMALLFLLFSLLLLISCLPLKFYRDLPGAKAWEPEIEELISQGQTEQYSDNAVIFTGKNNTYNLMLIL